MRMSNSDQNVVGKAHVTVGITQEDVEFAIVTSFEGGSNYWLAVNSSKPWWTDKPHDEPLSMWASQLLLEGKTIYLCDREDSEEQWELTLKKLINGFSKYIARYGMNRDKWDADTADSIIQYALFDKLVYG